MVGRAECTPACDPRHRRAISMIDACGNRESILQRRVLRAGIDVLVVSGRPDSVLAPSPVRMYRQL